MAPGSGKRKRFEQHPSHDEVAGRPSPHRPESLSMAQRDESRGGRGVGSFRGGRRQSRQASAASPVNGAHHTTWGSRSVSSSAPSGQHQRPTPKAAPGAEGLRPVTPAPTPALAAQPPQSQVATDKEESREPPAPYLYEYVSDEAIAQWHSSGKETVQQLANAVEDEVTAITLLDELVRSSLDGRLDALQAGSMVRDMIAQHQVNGKLDVVDLFLNIVSVLNLEDHGNTVLLALMTATNIDPEVIRTELDVDLLKTLPLVRTTFAQMRLRKTTNILYRQANFNLLREESEGYAKLVTEYFNTANEAVNNRDVSAEDAFQRVMALVGSFDLDVGRVLDITLDISANMLVRAYPFFVKFYRCSSWWPAEGLFDDIKYDEAGLSSFPSWLLPGAAQGMSDEEVEQMKQEERRRREPIKEERDARFWEDCTKRGMLPYFELGARKIKDIESVLPLLETAHRQEFGAKNAEVNVDRRKRIDEDRNYMRTTGFVPPPGNADAAQLLGFKLKFYASNARDEKDGQVPENLIALAAMLIKIGFISLRDLYPHLYPSDEDMPAEKTRLEKEKAEREAKERPGGGLNALAMAGALPDDTVPAVRSFLRAEKEKSSGGTTPKQDKKEDEPNVELPTPKNQKIWLLKALLAIGALPEALYILGRFPWLVDADTELPRYLHRLARKMLSKVAESVKPMADRTDIQETKLVLGDAAVVAGGTLLLKRTAPQKNIRWFGLEQLDPETGAQHRHYYPDWDDNIPICQNIDDVFTLCDTFLGFLGVKVGQDAELLGTLVRIAKSSLTGDFSKSNQARWLDLMRSLLIPALSLSKHNPGLTQAVYELLKLFPTSTRYDVYAEWYQGKTSRLPDMRSAFDYNKAEVKDVLRRVTNETGKKQARALAKVSFSSPGIVAMSMINQLESYSNMIPSLVECTRYFSLLAYDVLTWCLINSLGGQGRNRQQDDGMLTSQWLQALSQFAASLFLRYSVINPSPVLQYLAFELRSGNTTDLDVFEQLLNEMAGIRSDIDFNDAQVLAMAGGEHLRSVIVQQLHDKRHLRKEKLSRLIKALSDPGLIGPMLIAIAQERRVYPYHRDSQSMPLKVLGANLDKIFAIFMQYLEALKTGLKPEEFKEKIPDVATLIGDFGIEPGIAFTIYRPVLLHAIAEYDGPKAEGKKRTLSQEQSNVSMDVEMKENGIDAGKVSEAIEEGEASEGNADSPKPNGDLKRLPAQATQAVAVNGESGHWHPTLDRLIKKLPTVAPDLADRVSIPFYTTFWTLSLQEILVHTKSYDIEIDRLRAQAKDLTPSNRTNFSAVALKEMDRKKKGMVELTEKLAVELKNRVFAYQRTRMRLSKNEKNHWFARSMTKMDSDARHIGLLQECFLPRAMLSSLDAHYCFLMLKMLHDGGTPGFSTMHLLNQLFKKQLLAAIIFQCTQFEAAHFGRFLCEILKLLSHWHGNKEAYEKEAFGSGKRLLPGFAKKLDANGKPETHLEYEDFRRLLYNWHTYLNGALNICFESDEFMHIRNGILVLRAVSPVFPAITFMGDNLVRQVSKISEEDERKDLKTAAASLLGPVKHREKSWMMPQAFRLNGPAKEGKAGSRQPSARPETPQPEKGTPSKLDATAPDFKPDLTNGTARKESVAEDGEIRDGDAKTTDDVPAKKEMAEEVNAAGPIVNAPVKEAPQPASRSETPAMVPSKPPPRPAQPSAAPSSLPDRPQRTEMRPPLNKPLPQPPLDRGLGSYHGRPDDRYGRLDRPSDARPASRDHSPNRSRPRTPEREPYYSSRGPPPKEHPPRVAVDSRYTRDDGWGSGRREPLPPAAGPVRPPYDSRGRASGSMGQLPSDRDRRNERDAIPSSVSHPGPLPIVRPTSSSQQPSASQPSTPHSENPARLAMINRDNQRQEWDVSRDTPVDTPRDRERRNLRDERLHGGRDMRSEAPREQYSHPEQATELAPNAARRTRSTRDLGPEPRPELSYGRLNGPPEPPSGSARVPNGLSGRGGRQPNTQPHSLLPTSGTSEQLPSTSSRPVESPAVPRGPGARGHDRRESGPPLDRQPPSNSAPTTPAVDNVPAIHPSRVQNVSGAPPPISTALTANGPRSAVSPATATPTGPRGSHAPSRAPTGPSTATPPTGPQSSFDRQKRQGTQIADINATLQNSQGANGQGVNFRGAAAGNAQAARESTVSTQPMSAVIASPMEPPPRRSERGWIEPRTDLFGSREEPAASAGSRGGHRAPARRPEDHEDRHHTSRHPVREGRPDDLPPQRAPPHSMDDRRMAGRDDRRPRGEPPRDSRDTARPPRSDERPPQRPPPQDLPSSYGLPPAEWGRGADRRGLPPTDDRRSGRASARPEDYSRGGRREEERRLAPPPTPGDEALGGRKRGRGDDVGFEEQKRRRSGR